jgi:hypothetical protein
VPAFVYIGANTQQAVQKEIQLALVLIVGFIGSTSSSNPFGMQKSAVGL